MEVDVLTVKGCKGLIESIIHQAFKDALNYSDRGPDHKSARSFLTRNNELFCYYCELIDLEPEYVLNNFNRYDRKIKRKITIKFLSKVIAVKKLLKQVDVNVLIAALLPRFKSKQFQNNKTVSNRRYFSQKTKLVTAA